MSYESEISKLTRKYEDNPNQYFAVLADTHRKAGNFEQSIELLQLGLENRPNYVSGHIVLGRTRVDMGDTEEAVRAFEQVLELDNENQIALTQLADIAEQSGDAGGAVRWLTRLLEVDPMASEQAARLEELRKSVAGSEAETVEDGPEGTEAETQEMVPVSFADVLDETPEAKGGEQVEEEPPMGSEGEPSEAEETQVVEQQPQLAPALDEIETVVDMAPVSEPARISLDDLPTEKVVAIGGEGAADEPPVGTGNLDEAPGPITEIETAPMQGITDGQIEGSGVSDEGAEVAAPSEDVAAESEVPAGDGSRAEPQEALEPVDEPVPVDAEVTPTAEPQPHTVAAEEAPARPEPRHSTPLDDIPVIMPEDLDAVPEASDVVEEPAPDPVVTETMARVFVEQGMVQQAREVYRKLVEQDPDNQQVRAELERLEELPEPSVAEATTSRKRRYSVLDTGGESARSFLKSVLSSHLDAPNAPAPREPFAGPAGQESSHTRLSFDDFYGSQTATEATEKRAASDDDDFKNWLKGLKS